jgi:hypothetical protein
MLGGAGWWAVVGGYGGIGKAKVVKVVWSNPRAIISSLRLVKCMTSSVLVDEGEWKSRVLVFIYQQPSCHDHAHILYPTKIL